MLAYDTKEVNRNSVTFGESRFIAPHAPRVRTMSGYGQTEDVESKYSLKNLAPFIVGGLALLFLLR